MTTSTDIATVRPSSFRDKTDPHVLQAVVTLAAELARHGREGKPVGTIFVIGDERNVLQHSEPMILDPLAGHAPSSRTVVSPSCRGTLLELAQLDGAFVISSTGVAIAAARCLDVATDDVKLPMGLGSRHLAAASITLATDAVAVVVSESSSIIRLFHDGRVVDQIDAGKTTATDAVSTTSSNWRPDPRNPARRDQLPSIGRRSRQIGRAHA